MTIHGRNAATPPNLEAVRAYGDTLGDGQIQLSFTLPVPHGPEAIEAARILISSMGLREPRIYHSHDLGDGYSYFVLYATCVTEVDYTKIRVAKVTSDRLDFYQINAFIEEKIKRNIVVIGACTGDDAHSVGIDAIMNMKGYNGDYGLERYPKIDAYNLGMQIPNDVLVAKAVELKADALLVSQVVTQKDVHIKNLSELADMLEAEGIRDQLVLVAGGPRLNHEIALELGFDAGFGPGTTAPDVASYVIHEIVDRHLE